MEDISLKMISFAGEASRFAYEALDLIKTNQYQAAKAILSEGRGLIKQANESQRSLILMHCEHQEQQLVSLMMIHAQDHLMNAMLLLDLTEKMIEIFETKLGGN